LKQLIGYLKRFYQEEFDLRYTLIILSYFALLLYINFGDTYFNSRKALWRWQETSWLFYFLTYASALIPALLFYAFLKEKSGFLKNKKLWLLCLFGLAIFASRNSWYYYLSQHFAFSWDKSSVEAESTFRIFFALSKSAIGFVPIFIYWYLADRSTQPFYGMQRKQLNLKPYFVLLLLLIPFVAIASQDASFLRKYPRVLVIDTIEIFNPSMAKWILAYEALYILDFYIIELFFRGFMILAFIKIGGPKIILPVALFYFSIHFNKPFPEALSSFFGGTILGIITYYSRSIWGGIIIHMGIAAVMEIGAYIGHWLQK